MAQGNIQIQVKTNVSMNKEDIVRMQRQLNKMAEELYLNINKVNLASSKMSSSASSGAKQAAEQTEQATKKNTKATSEYEASVKKLIHTYKMKEISEKNFIQNAKELKKQEEFQNLTYRQQEQLLNNILNAQKKLSAQRKQDSLSTRQSTDVQNQYWANKIGQMVGSSFTAREQALTEKVTQTTKKQMDSIDKLILRYKAGELSAKQFMEYGRRIEQSQNFANKSLEQRAKLIQNLERVESKYNATRLRQQDIENRSRLSLASQRTRETNLDATYGNFNSQMQYRLNQMQTGRGAQFINQQELAVLQQRLNTLTQTFLRMGNKTVTTNLYKTMQMCVEV